MYGKLKDNILVIIGNVIQEEGVYIVYPTKEQYLQFGYKKVIFNKKPEYDPNVYNLKQIYVEDEEKIYVNYELIEKTKEEKINKLKDEINKLETQQQSDRLMREVSLGYSESIARLRTLDNAIKVIREELRKLLQ